MTPPLPPAFPVFSRSEVPGFRIADDDDAAPMPTAFFLPRASGPRFALRGAVRVAAFLGAISVLGVLWLFSGPAVPASELHAATEALLLARRNEADRHAPALWRQANEEWTRTLALVREENDTWAPLRRYGEARRAAHRTLVAGHAAASEAQVIRDSLHRETADVLHAVTSALQVLEPVVRRLPPSEATRDLLARIRTTHYEAELARGRGDVQTALAHSAEAATQSASLIRHVQGLLGTLSANRSLWEGWVADAVARSSRTGDRLLVVDKIHRSLVLFEDGTPVRTFDVELGPNWIGPKRWEGDGATPEGRYWITGIRGRGETVYTRSLLFNYPNAEDRARFTAGRQSGTVSAGASIGGDLAIHGRGDRGADWTRGCVALSDSDVRWLAARVPVGTPLVVVGGLDVPASYHDVLALDPSSLSTFAPSPTPSSVDGWSGARN